MTLEYSLIDDIQDNLYNKKNKLLEKKRNYKGNKTKKISSFYDSVPNNNETPYNSDDEENALSDFVPLTNKPISAGVENSKVKEEVLVNKDESNDTQDNDIVTNEIFNNLEGSYQTKFYNEKDNAHLLQFGNQNIQTDNKSNFNNDLLLKKINYMISLLEQQQDEKTEKTSEELILYIFLGVFIIFVLDSFSKVGKYIR